MRIWILAALVAVLAQSGWTQEPVRGISLAEAIRAAYQRNPRLRAARAEADASRAEARMARAGTLPQLSASAYAARSSMPMIASSAPGVMPENAQMLPEGSYSDANVMLMAPLFTGGLLQGKARAGSEQSKAARAMLLEAEAEVALAVTEAYLGALAAREMERAETSRVNAMQETLRLTRARVEVGREIEASVRRAEAELAEAQQMLVLARSERQKMGLELLAEMAASMDQPIEPIDPLTFAPPAESLEAHVKAAKEQRGDSLAAQARVRSAEAQLSSARGALSPQLYGFAMGDSFRSSEMGSDSGYSIGVVASLPIFDGGMRSAEIDRASAALRQAKAERDAVDLRVEREVRQAWIDVQAAAENYATAESALKAAEAAYEVARVRYESGRAILIEQLDALSSLTRARASLVRTLSDHQIAVARLGRAAGFRPEINQGDKT